eukprot:11187773-Lingulodinium_polyedra.AAC.1
MQEHHKPEGELGGLEQWATKHHWKLSLQPAAASGKGGTQGGVGIAGRRQYGLRCLPGAEAPCPARLTLRHATAAVAGGIVLGSVYLLHGEGVGPTNWRILCQ